MQVLADLLSAVLRTVFKLALLAAALVFILSLLCVALVSVVVVLVKALLTGRKPALVTTFSRFTQASQQFRAGEWPSRRADGFPRGAPDDVMDVQAREVRHDPALPYGSSHDKS